MTQPVRSVEAGAISQSRPKTSSIPCCIPESSPGKNGSLQRIADVLVRVDELGHDATGAVVFEGAEGKSGAILLERGRICWAVARGLKRRMVEILRHQEQPPPPASVVEEVFRGCQESGQPFGEALVARGLVSTTGLRKALRQQTAEAISVLAAPRASVLFLKHKNQGYNAQYSFSGAEILVALGALRDVDAAVRATNRLKELLPPEVSGVVFSRGLGAAPVAIGLVERMSLEVVDLANISQWASSAIDISHAVGGNDQVRLVSLSDAFGRSIALWQDGDLMFAAICPSGKTLARVLMGVSRR